mmetsp:Transcript_2419/g.9383  ORF Transcript_2419/g.9383 Transcript_2419/m.9383 type:complete len:340 (+) Transcript_2419:13741-14760(+)
MIRKFGCATNSSTSAPPFSGNVRVRPGSKTLFKRSKTLSSARDSSSTNKISPCFIANTKGPSSHANGSLFWFWVSFSVSFSSLSSSIPLSPPTNCSPALLRVGRNPPRKSPVSVCWWQFRIRSFWPRSRLSNCTMDVFPHPVSPTRSAGSSCSKQVSTRENKRFAAGVQAIASDNAAASSASRRACDASAFASGLVALTSASFAEAFAPAAASCSLNLSASPSAATYIFVSLDTEKSLTFKTSIKVCFKASLSSSDRTRSPKTRNPSWASSSYPLDFRFAHRKRSLAVTKPSFPANARDAARRRCKSRITSTIFDAYEGATPQRLFRITRSSSSGISPT